ncbi:tetratricopeptide repeat protein [Stieleria sp. JC731]|uniref:tetratricopeptide repeat protein n=1 Tax=Pirellulaceae TaxID=2691357 RepID=UPI001E43C8C6|nr:tetratricopeptide repeat protein [Stieleria sp. JC731]MCC9603633.1 tetratricopeptide repeat protein [Stieleria sp. JC731]
MLRLLKNAPQLVVPISASVLTTSLLIASLSPITASAQEVADDTAAAAAGSESANSAEGDSENATEAATPDAGQDDLDEAAILGIDAKQPAELRRVELLLQSAMKKGLTGENASFAKKMLGSVLLKKAQQMLVAMRSAQQRTQIIQLRDEALRTLQEALENEPELVDAHLLIAQLNLLPGGDKKAVTESTTRAIEILKDRPVERSAAYVLRALNWGPGNEEKRLEDLNSAINDDPKNLEALQARAALKLQDEDVAGAIEDMERVMAQDPNNRLVEPVVQKLAELNRLDEALKLLTQALEANPSEALYRMRAILYRMQSKEDEALADLNKALAIQPRDPISLLQRAEIAIGNKNLQGAKDDLRAAERIDPRVALIEQAIAVRCMIAMEEGRMSDAINELKTLIERNPENTAWQLQLAGLYIQDDRPRQAADLMTAILERDPDNIGALRTRADAYLNTGMHQKAIDDYETAIDILGDSKESRELPGILNNYAWVLATSPEDSIRNGAKAVELATKAVELTDSSMPHILSTLAAAYAENGEFEKAIEWSTKAVETGKEQDHEQVDQLQEELDQYKTGKPWREKQEVKENATPILSPDDLIDT